MVLKWLHKISTAKKIVISTSVLYSSTLRTVYMLDIFLHVWCNILLWEVFCKPSLIHILSFHIKFIAVKQTSLRRVNHSQPGKLNIRWLQAQNVINFTSHLVNLDLIRVRMRASLRRRMIKTQVFASKFG